MDGTVKGSALKKILVSLARFAETRERAPEPQNQIVIQANGDTLKVVAGSEYGTLIASVHATTQTFRAIVSAREFLRALKGVKAKSDYKIEDLNLGWEIGCSLMEDGEKVQSFQRMSKTLPRFILPPDKTAHTMGHVQFKAAELKEWGAIMGGVPHVSKDTGIAYYMVGVEGAITTLTDEVRFGVTDNRVAAMRGFPGDFQVYGRLHPTFCEAIREIGDCVMEFYDSNLVVVENDTYKAIGQFGALEKGSPVSFDNLKVPLEKIEYKTVVDRTSLIKQLREQAKFDNYDRIGLQLNDNVLEVKAFDDAKHGWHADSKLLLNVLGATSVKQVGLGFRIGCDQPISVRIPEWTIEVMPVKLQPAKSLTSA